MKKKIDLYGILFLLVVFAYLIFIFSRINIGYAMQDECFFPSVAYRLSQGDRLLVDEWHVSQLTGFLLYPLMKIFLWFSGGTDGVIIFFRYCYVIMQIITICIGYILLSRHSKINAIFINAIYALFVPYCVTALSYNTLGLAFMYLMICLLLYNTNHLLIKYMLVGILYALAVLMCPYLIVLFVAQFILSLCIKDPKDELFCKKIVLYVAIGGVCVLTVFCLFVLARATPHEIIGNVKYILADKAHQKTIIMHFRPLASLIYRFGFYVIPASICAVLTIANKIKKTTNIYIQIVLAVYMLLYCITIHSVYNAIMLPLTIVGINIILCIKNINKGLITRIMVIPIMYAFCLNLSSNQGLSIMFMAFSLSSAFSLILIKKYLENIEDVKKMCVICFCIMICTQIVSEATILKTRFFGELNVEELTYQIDKGPLKGIYTNINNKRDYDINYNNINDIKNHKDKNVLIYRGFIEGIYVLKNACIGGFSAWMNDNTSGLDDELIQKYNDLHPEKVPDIIYIETNTVPMWTDEKWVEYSRANGYEIKKYNNGGLLLIK